jgi:hypothetical protein
MGNLYFHNKFIIYVRNVASPEGDATPWCHAPRKLFFTWEITIYIGG